MPLTLSDGAAELSDQFASLPASNPASPFYQPPPGYYQDNSGNLVSNGTPSHTFATPSGVSAVSAPSTTSTASTPSASSSFGVVDAAKEAASLLMNGKITPSGVAKSSGLVLENVVFIITGLLLVAAGVFAFKTTQSVIDISTNVVKKGVKAGKTIAEASA